MSRNKHHSPLIFNFCMVSALVWTQREWSFEVVNWINAPSWPKSRHLHKSNPYQINCFTRHLQICRFFWSTLIHKQFYQYNYPLRTLLHGLTSLHFIDPDAYGTWVVTSLTSVQILDFSPSYVKPLLYLLVYAFIPTRPHIKLHNLWNK